MFRDPLYNYISIDRDTDQCNARCNPEHDAGTATVRVPRGGPIAFVDPEASLVRRPLRTLPHRAVVHRGNPFAGPEPVAVRDPT